MKIHVKMISILFVSQFPLFPSPNYAYKSGWAIFCYFQHFYYCRVNAFFTNYYPTPRKSKSSSVTNLVDTCFKERGTSYDIFQEVGSIKNASRTQYLTLMLRFVESNAFYTKL